VGVGVGGVTQANKFADAVFEPVIAAMKSARKSQVVINKVKYLNASASVNTWGGAAMPMSVGVFS